MKTEYRSTWLDKDFGDFLNFFFQKKLNAITQELPKSEKDQLQQDAADLSLIMGTAFQLSDSELTGKATEETLSALETFLNDPDNIAVLANALGVLSDSEGYQIAAFPVKYGLAIMNLNHYFGTAIMNVLPEQSTSTDQETVEKRTGQEEIPEGIRESLRGMEWSEFIKEMFILPARHMDSVSKKKAFNLASDLMMAILKRTGQDKSLIGEESVDKVREYLNQLDNLLEVTKIYEALDEDLSQTPFESVYVQIIDVLRQNFGGEF
jgi:hypothetical protein